MSKVKAARYEGASCPETVSGRCLRAMDQGEQCRAGECTPRRPVEAVSGPIAVMLAASTATALAGATQTAAVIREEFGITIQPEPERCRVCAQPVLVMCMKNTGYCSQEHERGTPWT